MKEVRTLRADEIETRVQQVKQKGCVLLLYKDSRADMKILDETFGILGWQRHHTRDNKNCIISVWDEEKKQWIEKEDTGTESNTEQAKGLASDSFKRAGVNFGIGRELYSCPFIWINLDSSEVKQNGNKYQLNYGVEFYVDTIEYDSERVITKLVVKDKNNKIRYTYNQNKQQNTPVPTETKKEDPITENQAKTLRAELNKKIKSGEMTTDSVKSDLKKHYGVDNVDKLTKKQASEAIKRIKGE